MPNPEDPLQLLESLRKCIENDKKNTIKQISDITAKLKTCEKGNEALKRQFQTELQAEQEIRRWMFLNCTDLQNFNFFHYFSKRFEWKTSNREEEFEELSEALWSPKPSKWSAS